MVRPRILLHCKAGLELAAESERRPSMSITPPNPRSRWAALAPKYARLRTVLENSATNIEGGAKTSRSGVVDLQRQAIVSIQECADIAFRLAECLGDTACPRNNICLHLGDWNRCDACFDEQVGRFFDQASKFITAIAASAEPAPLRLRKAKVAESNSCDVFPERAASFTVSQQRVFELLARGLPNKLIAYEIGVSEATIKAHVSLETAVWFWREGGESRILKGMKRDSSSPWAHRPGEQSVVVAERLEGVDLDCFFGPVRLLVPLYPARRGRAQIAKRTVGHEGVEQSGRLEEVDEERQLPKRRHRQAGRSRHGDAFHARRPQALRTHRGVALRRRAAGPARDEEDRQRGRDPARLQGGRRDGRGGLAAPTPARLCGAAAVRALDSRRRYDDQAALRSSGRGGSRLQSQEAGASEPLLSHVLDGFDASDPRCRCQPRGRACIQTQRAEPLGAARSFAARPVASLVAGRPRL